MAAHVQKLFAIEQRKPPVIRVARQEKNDNLLPILHEKEMKKVLITAHDTIIILEFY